MTASARPVVMITGAAGYVGRAVAKEFLTLGTRLCLIDHAPDRLERLYPELLITGDHYLGQSIDVNDAELLENAVNETVRQLGSIDVLVNTVGTYLAGTPLDEMDATQADILMGINARSVFVACQKVIPVMRRQHSGRIISISSKGGLKGEAGASIYSASKAVVIRLTESMADELKGVGITVNCVLPALIDTTPNREAIPGADYSKWVTPQSVAKVIAFLASDAARDITGAAIPISGRL